LKIAIDTAIPITPAFSRVQNFWQNGECANCMVATCIFAHLSWKRVMDSAYAPGRMLSSAGRGRGLRCQQPARLGLVGNGFSQPRYLLAVELVQRPELNRHVRRVLAFPVPALYLLPIHLDGDGEVRCRGVINIVGIQVQRLGVATVCIGRRRQEHDRKQQAPHRHSVGCLTKGRWVALLLRPVTACAPAGDP
jgi:hypothetical protein